LSAGSTTTIFLGSNARDYYQGKVDTVGTVRLRTEAGFNEAPELLPGKSLTAGTANDGKTFAMLQ
jgi:hypothetical protein